MTKHLQTYKNHMAHAPVHFLYGTEKSNGNLFHISQRLFPLVYMREKKALRCFISAKSKRFKSWVYYT